MGDNLIFFILRVVIDIVTIPVCQISWRHCFQHKSGIVCIIHCTVKWFIFFHFYLQMFDCFFQLYNLTIFVIHICIDLLYIIKL